MCGHIHGEARDWHQMPFSVTWTPILGAGLSFNQEFMNWTYWLAQEPQESSCFCSSTLSATVTDMYLASFTWVPRYELGSSCLHSGTSDWAISLAYHYFLCHINPEKAKQIKTPNYRRHKCNNFLLQLWQHLTWGLAVNTGYLLNTINMHTIWTETLRTSAPGSKPAFWTHCFKHTISPPLVEPPSSLT